MTPDDVAAIRAYIENDCVTWGEMQSQCRALCDALEQAWAERDAFFGTTESALRYLKEAQQERLEWRDRAEIAEAELAHAKSDREMAEEQADGWRDQAERAEALLVAANRQAVQQALALARVRAILDDHDYPEGALHDIRAAIVEETGQ